MLKQLLLVGLGGGIGSILRYLTSVLTEKYYSNSFPLATFLVNILGCFLIGIIVGLLAHSVNVNENMKYLFVVGFCGGFTTFSTFASENWNLINNHNYWMAALYIGLSVVVGIIAVWVGLWITK